MPAEVSPRDERPRRERRVPPARAPRPRDESRWLRPIDICSSFNVSATTGWRLRQLLGFPRPNGLGRYNAAEVQAFIAAMRPGALRDVRASRERAETASVEAPGVAPDSDRRTTRRISKTAPAESARSTKRASAEPARSIESPAGAAAKLRARRGKANSR